MAKRKILVWVLPCLLLVSGCATLNVSSFETALPAPEDETSVTVSVSTGLELGELFFPDSTWVRTGWDSEGNYLFPVPCILVDSYIGERTSGVLKFWTTLGSLGLNFHGKYQLDRYEDNYLAVLPGLNFVAGFGESLPGDEEDELFYNYTLGAELQLLFTHAFNEDVSVTVSGRGAGELFWQEKMDDSQSEYDYEPTVFRNTRGLWHYGWRTNLRFRVGKLHLIPEGGVEYLRLRHGRILLEPIVGLGLEF